MSDLGARIRKQVRAESDEKEALYILTDESQIKEWIEPGIRPLCRICWDAGIETAQSCDGHGIKPGNIWFWEKADALRAARLLVDYEPGEPVEDPNYCWFWQLQFPIRHMGEHSNREAGKAIPEIQEGTAGLA